MQSVEQKRRIVVGDIHGEVDGFREILRNAGLIDNKDNWSGSDCILIQTGDVIDRGPYSRETIALLRNLQKEAIHAKGAVIRLCGNHELMLLQGKFFYANFTNPASLMPELTEEIAKGNVQAAYSDGARLYSHAGLRSAIRQALMAEMGTIGAQVKERTGDLDRLAEHINGIFRQAVEKDDLERHPIFHVGPERGGDNDVGGIFWCDFSKISPSLEAWTIPQIFGHTPTRQNRVQTAQGLKLIDVDAGMCRVYGGARVYLEITEEGDLLQHSKALSKWTVTPLAAQ
ncbi:MAG: metallophosphoesterase [Syntrophobacterales bacterium]|nr:metallophosphoesterase [Syntrophobacterales bacterium]